MASTLIDDLGLMRPAPQPPRPRDVGDWVQEIAHLAATAVVWLVLALIAAVAGAASGGLLGVAALLIALDGLWSP